MSPLHVHRAWRLQRVAQRLFISGGLDATYLLEELEGDTLERFAAAWESGSLSHWADLPRHTVLCDKLLMLGALFRPQDLAGPLPRVGLRWAGTACEPFARALAAAMGERCRWVDAPEADISLVVRTDASMVETSQRTADLGHPHLLVDLAHHETVVIGPFVVRGETACLGCLAGRMNQLWGDPPPAAEPAMLSRAVLVASLVAEHLQTFGRQRSMPALVQQAWSLSLVTWETQLHPVFLLPWCPLCQGGPAGAADGRLPF